MKSIGIVCYPTFGGSGIIASELGRGLSKNYNIHFISYKKPVRFDPTNHNFYYHKVNVPLYPLFEYPPYELALTTTIVEVVKKYNLDIIHVHYAIPHAYAAVNAQQILLDQNIKIPIITTLHGTDITLVGKSPDVISAVNYAINKSSMVTTVSESLKLDTLKYFDIKQDIKVIPNFIDIKKSSFVSKKNHQKKIIHISNFRPVKRVLDVIRVFDHISKKIPAELVLIGDGPDFQKAKILANKKGLKTKIDFVGKSRKINEALIHADLFILPSESESFGLVALEAMSFGVPVIATSSGGIESLVINNKNGYTCKVGDISDMSSKAIGLLLDQVLYEKMSASAYDTAKKYDITRILPMYESCYLSLLS